MKAAKLCEPAVTQMTCSAESRAFLCSTYVNDQMENIIVLYMYIPSSRWIPDCQLADNQGSDQHKADAPCVTCWLVWQLLNFHFWSSSFLSSISSCVPDYCTCFILSALATAAWFTTLYIMYFLPSNVHLQSAMFAAAPLRCYHQPHVVISCLSLF